MGNERIKNIALIVLVIGTISITIAYAFLTQQLIIRNNSATLSKSSWDIHFESSGEGAVPTAIGDSSTVTVDNEPNLTATTITGLQATFRKPGDGVSYKFKVVNKGNINAKLKAFTKGPIVCTSSDTTKLTNEQAQTLCDNYLEYTLTYTSNNNEVKVDDLLNINDSKEVILNLKLKNNLQTSIDTNINISGINATFDYEQN